MLEALFIIGIFLAAAWLYGVRYQRIQQERVKAAVAAANTARDRLDSAKVLVTQAQYQVRSATKRVIERGDKLDTNLVALQKAALAIPADGVTVEVQALLEEVDSVRVAAQLYRSQVDSLVLFHDKERRAFDRAIAQADSTVAAYDTVIQRMRAAECRIGKLPCPTRTQSFLAGAFLLVWLTR